MAPRYICQSCLEAFQPTEVHFSDACTHPYCTECIRKMIELSVKPAEIFPPRCCELPIPLTPQLAMILSREIRTAYFEKLAEMNTQNAAYCSRPDCGAFIPVEYQTYNLAVCKKCDWFTCSRCGNNYHEGQCPIEPGLSELQAIAEKKGWKRCACGRLIERIDGCESIICICGRDLCYDCSREIGDCICNELYRQREEEAEEEDEEEEEEEEEQEAQDVQDVQEEQEGQVNLGEGAAHKNVYTRIEQTVNDAIIGGTSGSVTLSVGEGLNITATFSEATTELPAPLHPQPNSPTGPTAERGHDEEQQEEQEEERDGKQPSPSCRHHYLKDTIDFKGSGGVYP
ncbi:uncharacterized protein F4822DRAFT_439887 [Hypoxylon trugodes]|uniref:uncharacterized protein n=1 Tax=Hypoxylon trugodes TaxID=326681 RepID=UPI00219B0BFB|nr:uncharacterized protein F4822DRAFT_439887 [Hypoxylon trugodes]KAI1394209.1 hypothetical protein F4822DRAFT_439887 [Hypoxylon trugodes]